MARTLFESLTPVLVGMLSSRITGPHSAPAFRKVASSVPASASGMAVTALGTLVSDAILNRTLGHRRGIGARLLRMAAPIAIGSLTSRLIARANKGRTA